MKDYNNLKKYYLEQEEDYKAKLIGWKNVKRIKTKDGKDFKTLSKNFNSCYFTCEYLLNYVKCCYGKYKTDELCINNLKTADDVEKAINNLVLRYQGYLKETRLIIKGLAGFYDKVVKSLESLKNLDDKYKAKAGNGAFHDVLFNILDRFSLSDLDYLDYSDFRNKKAKEKSALLKNIQEIKASCNLTKAQEVNLNNAVSQNVEYDGNHCALYKITDSFNNTLNYIYDFKLKKWTNPME